MRSNLQKITFEFQVFANDCIIDRIINRIVLDFVTVSQRRIPNIFNYNSNTNCPIL